MCFTWKYCEKIEVGNMFPTDYNLPKKTWGWDTAAMDQTEWDVYFQPTMKQLSSVLFIPGKIVFCHYSQFLW